jgi:hypothetical protein
MITSDGRTSVEIEIESLALTGFRSSDRYQITASVQSELARLIESKGLPATDAAGSMDFPGLDAGSFKLRAGASPASIGAQIARSLYHSISKAMHKGSE